MLSIWKYINRVFICTAVLCLQSYLINAQSIANITVSPNDTVCPGTVATFIANVMTGCGATSYQWYKNGIFTGTSGSIYSYTPLNGDWIYCIVTASGGPCGASTTGNSDTLTMSVLPYISPSALTTLCTGQTDTLQGSPAGGTWSSSAPGIASVSSTGILTGVLAGTTVITYSLGSACYTTITVSVNTSPNAGSISGPDSLCIGAGITLADTVAGGTWACGTGTTINSSGMLTATVAGSYVVTYTVHNTYCYATALKNITVHALPNAGIITGLISTCPGANLTYSVTVAGGIWSSTIPAVATINSTTGLLHAVSTGLTVINYTVGPDVHGCSGTSFLNVNVAVSSFTLTATTTDVLCHGDSTGTVALAITPADTGYSYVWSNGNTNDTITSLPKGTYSVQVTQAPAQCSQNAVFIVNEPASLTVSIVATPAMCEDDGMLTAKAAGGVSGYRYLWRHDTTTYPGDIVAPAPYGTYTLSVTDSNNCMREWQETVPHQACNSIYIAGGLSPNGDGINDTWNIGGLNLYPLNAVLVVDKWGNQVYERSPYDNSWNGKNSNGSDLPDGTYYFVLKFNEPSKTGGDDVFKGTVIIKR